MKIEQPAIEITAASFRELQQQQSDARQQGATCLKFQGVEIELEFVDNLIKTYAPRVARWER
jgi:hypothetical protein